MSKHFAFETPRTPVRRFGADWAALLIFGLVANLLTLTGPLFMLQVYDRVLPSRSTPTLLVLLALAGLLYAAHIALDVIRARIGIRIGAAYQSLQDINILQVSLHQTGAPRETDLDQIRRFTASPLPVALIDLPFTPLFLIAIALLHPALALLALAGATVIIALSLANQLLSRGASARVRKTRQAAHAIGEDFRRAAPDLGGLGLTRTAARHWHRARNTALIEDVQLSARTATSAALIRGIRLMLQSGLLALGAWLVIRGETSGGAMIAASVLMGRALQPIEQIVGGWPLLQATRASWMALRGLPTQTAEPPAMLPVTRAELEVRGLVLPLLPRLDLSLMPGSALGIIGESASGKTTLLRALGGMVAEAAGRVKLSGVPLGQIEPDRRARLIGYLPQQSQLFSGTIAANITRFDPDPDGAAMVRAAERAGAHDVITRLEDGYETRVGAGGRSLSGGEVQRIALARALYGDPLVVLLDEPDSHLDARGTAAVNAAIRALKDAGRIVILIAHRPAMLAECDLALHLRPGQPPIFGPRDEVIARATLPHPVGQPT